MGTLSLHVTKIPQGIKGDGREVTFLAEVTQLRVSRGPKVDPFDPTLMLFF
jgi:hypothetical protein